MSEGGAVEVFIVDHNGSHYRPNLILPNLLAVKNLKEYLEEVLEAHTYGKVEQEEDENEGRGK